MTSQDPASPSASARPLDWDLACLHQVLVEQALDVITVIDAFGVVLFMNRSSDGLLGYAQGELIGRPLLDFVHPDDVPVVTTALGALLHSTDPSPRLLHRFKHKDGSWRRFESVGRHQPDLPWGGCFIVNSREIPTTERVESPETYERGMGAMGLMTDAIVHGFNNLLIVLTACADAIEKEPHQLNSTIATMRGALERATTLTRHLLEFTPQRHTTPATVDVNHAIVDLRPILCLLLGPNVELRLRTEAVPARVGISPTAFDQILINLATNAREAMPAGGVLRITTSNIRAALPQGPPGSVDAGLRSWLVFEVADTGLGMLDDVRSRIFEPFFTTKGEARGAGLGLPTILAIIRRAAGHISVESAPGHGSTFRVFLPVVEG